MRPAHLLSRPWTVCVPFLFLTSSFIMFLRSFLFTIARQIPDCFILVSLLPSVTYCNPLGPQQPQCQWHFDKAHLYFLKFPAHLLYGKHVLKSTTTWPSLVFSEDMKFGWQENDSRHFISRSYFRICFCRYMNNLGKTKAQRVASTETSIIGTASLLCSLCVSPPSAKLRYKAGIFEGERRQSCFHNDQKEDPLRPPLFISLRQRSLQATDSLANVQFKVGPPGGLISKG